MKGKSVLFGVPVSGNVDWDAPIVNRPVNVQLDG